MKPSSPIAIAAVLAGVITAVCGNIGRLFTTRSRQRFSGRSINKRRRTLSSLRSAGGSPFAASTTRGGSAGSTRVLEIGSGPGEIALETVRRGRAIEYVEPCDRALTYDLRPFTYRGWELERLIVGSPFEGSRPERGRLRVGTVPLAPFVRIGLDRPSGS